MLLISVKVWQFAKISLFICKTVAKLKGRFLGECINTLRNKTYFTILHLKCGHVPEILKGSMFGPNGGKDGDEDGLYAKRESLDIPGHKW